MTAKQEQDRLNRKADRLYDRYVKPLEADHYGDYIAVSPKGQVILGADMLEVAKRATDAFGRGNFVFKLEMVR